MSKNCKTKKAESNNNIADANCSSYTSLSCSANSLVCDYSESLSVGTAENLAVSTIDCSSLDCNSVISTISTNINGYYQPTITTTEPYYYPWKTIETTNNGIYSIGVDLASLVSDMTEFRLKSNRKRINLKFNL